MEYARARVQEYAIVDQRTDRGQVLTAFTSTLGQRGLILSLNPAIQLGDYGLKHRMSATFEKLPFIGRLGVVKIQPTGF